MTTGIRRDCQCPRANHKHGTIPAYTRDACRCDECRNASRVARAEERRLKAYGRYKQRHVNPARTRRHIQQLRNAGIIYEQIANLSGVALSTVLLIARDGRSDVRPATEARILAVKPVPENIRPGTIIDGTGTSRRITALIATGWTQVELARELNMRPANLWKIAQNRQQVTTETAKTVSDLYERLWDKPPAPVTPDQQRNYTRAKNAARANGWLPPLCWDEDKLDDPTHEGYASAIREAA